MKKRIISILMALVMALSLLPAGALAAGLPFTDVKTSDWFYNDVKNAYDKGLINGKTATTFEPNSNLTYAEAVKLAACMNQRNATGMVTLVNGNPWYATYVGYAQDNGIISKDYDWNAKATRAGYMEIFANALPAANLKPVNNVPDGAIPDVPMSHPQADAIYTLYRAGILQGSDSQHSCKPNDNIKRSEVAAILTRMMDVKERISFSMAEEVEELTITAQPKDVTCSVGDTVTFTVAASGGKAPYTYQWQTYSRMKWGSINGATSATYTYKNVSDASFSSSIRCVITDADGNTVTSNEAKVVKAETTALTITTQPKDVATTIGSGSSAFNVGFTVAVTGGKAPYTYQWQWGKTTGSGWNNFTGSENWAVGYASSSLSIGSSNKAMLNAGYQFRCVITDANGTKVTSNAAKLTDSSVLRITSQPVFATGNDGDTVSFKVAVAGGKTPYTYQWKTKLNRELPTSGNVMKSIDNSARSATLSFKLGEINNNTTYFCVITDAAGNEVISDEVSVYAAGTTVPLTITVQPKDVVINEGDKTTLSVTVSGGKAPYTYEWYRCYKVYDYSGLETKVNFYWLNTNNANTQNYTVSEAGEYRCLIRDSLGNKLTSNEIEVSYLKPLSVDIKLEYDIMKASVTGGVGPYTYQWTKDGSGNKVVGMGTSYRAVDNGTYTCIVTDSLGNTAKDSYRYAYYDH